MFKISHAFATKTRFAQRAANSQVLAVASTRNFSLLQNELEKHDFSDPLNVEELKLKHPT